VHPSPPSPGECDQQVHPRPRGITAAYSMLPKHQGGGGRGAVTCRKLRPAPLGMQAVEQLISKPAFHEAKPSPSVT
jgi:hypothetical protein